MTGNVSSLGLFGLSKFSLRKFHAGVNNEDFGNIFHIFCLLSEEQHTFLKRLMLRIRVFSLWRVLVLDGSEC